MDEIIGVIPKEEEKKEIEKFKIFGDLTLDEKKTIRKIMDIAGQLSALEIMTAVINHEKFDPYMRRKVKQLKDIIPIVKTEV